MKKIILILGILLVLCGCYDYKELNQINIVTSIGIDYKDDEYEVSLEVVNSEKDGTNTKISTDIIKGTDKVLANAFNKAINSMDKNIYMEHLKLLILSNNVCNNGIDNVIDFTIRDIHLSNNFAIVLTSDIDKLLHFKVDNDTVSNKIVDMMETLGDKKKQEDVDLVASHLLNKKRDVAFSIVEVDDDIKISSIGYFSNDKLLNVMDNKIYNFILLNNSTTNFFNDDNVINVYKKTIKYEISKDKIIMKIDGHGEVKELNSKYDLKNKNDYLEIQKGINEQIEKEIMEFLETTYDNGSDLLGFKDMYYKKYKQECDNIEYQVKVDIKLSKNGSINEVLHD